MDSFDRKLLLLRGLYHENREVKHWFGVLKRCFPWPDWALHRLLFISGRQFWVWKRGKGRPAARVVGHMAHLIMFRIGAAETGRDLLEADKLIATGELEKMVDDFLAAEGRAERRRMEREALRYAQSRGELP